MADTKKDNKRIDNSKKKPKHKKLTPVKKTKYKKYSDE